MSVKTKAQDAVIAIMFPKKWNKSKRNGPAPEIKYDALFNFIPN